MSWFSGILDDNTVTNVPEEKSGSFEALPQGNYNVGIKEVELKDTKAGTGKYVSVMLEIIEGEYKGRKLWDNWNIKNPSEKAQEIGLGRMKRVYKLAGLGELKDNEPTTLCGKSFCVYVTIKMYNGKEQNNIASYDMPHDLKGLSDPAGAASKPDWM